jgi:tRNA-splicing ligase RtcB
MSLLQTDVPAEEIADRRVRRALIDAIRQLIPSGLGQGRASPILWEPGIVAGFEKNTCNKFDIPPHWIERCEDASHGRTGTLAERMDWHRKNQTKDFHKMDQFGTYGAGNHFGEATVVEVHPLERDLAARWGLKDGCVAMLSHCGSRGFGYSLAGYHFKRIQKHYKKWKIRHPGDDRELMYIPVDTAEGQEYLQDIAMAGNFATVNHMIINANLVQAFQSVIPGCTADLIYYISHNFVRKEYDGHRHNFVHRKGATRAFPAGHHELKGTSFYETGHPILLPGNPVAGSRVMVACDDAKDTYYSINHGAGRCMGRKDAKRTLVQADVDKQMEDNDILFHGRHYPLDEAASAYKDFEAVLDSVAFAGLARPVAKLGPARFVIKGADQ